MPAAPLDRAARIGYVYPWDDPDRIIAWCDRLEITRVAVAAIYHSVRAVRFDEASPHLVDAWHSARYLPVSGRFAPPPPSGWSAADSFASMCERLQSAEISVDAWAVLNHHSNLGRAHPDLAVRNAVGDQLSVGLCPNQPPVADLQNRMVAAVAASAADGITIEAVGPLGYDHPVAHDKSQQVGWTAHLSAWASLCFCERCQAARTAANINAADLHSRIVRALRSGDLTTRGDDVVEAAFALRNNQLAARASELVASARAAGLDRVNAFAGAPDHSFGPALPLAASAGLGLDASITSVWQLDETSVARLTDVATHGLAPHVGAYVTLLGGTVPRRAQLEAIAAAGVDELHLYHLGLAHDDTLAALARSLNVAR